ncbi:tRNA lysidine(34) synthetase TilS [Flavobacterium ardleyense]|uniref:tRNA(Ile)-lysidine synthase n=1 Tax=Flavobacterium ardleyense TaxID=2038737 RepID=A0ABW5Z963_9FLAO
MLTKFKNHIQTNFATLKDQKLLLAISGGIDSMVLLRLFHELNFNISVVHCNFMLRDEASNIDEDFVRTTCGSLNIPTYIQRFYTNQLALDYKLSIQLAARKIRYEWFSELLQTENLDCVLTAHHLDDQIETFLINLTRGTGLEGLTGIPEVNGTIIRPLLIFTREEIENYAKENDIKWREDASNASNKYLRNKLRHDVVPILKELNPSFMQSFQNTLNHLKQAQTLVDDASRIIYKKVVQEETHHKKIKISELTQLDNYKSYLFQWLKPLGFSAWEDIYDLVNAQSGKQVFSEKYVLLKDRDSFIVSEKNTAQILSSYNIKKGVKEVKYPLKLAINAMKSISNPSNAAIFVDEEKITYPLILRKWQEGDFFYPSGMNGKKKLSKYFKDEKYSLLDKENQWLLCSEDQIIWIIGKRADNRFIADEHTQLIIKIEI